MTETHSKSPLQETLLHLVFMPQSTYDITFPGIFYNEIKDQYPEKLDKAIGVINVPPIDDGSKSIEGNLTVFKAIDGSRQLQLGKDILVINISNYYSWSSWKEEVKRVLEIYQNLRGNQIQIRQAGLGFMNKFDVPEDDLYEVLNISLPNPEGEEYSEVMSISTQINFIRGDDILTQNFKTIGTDDDGNSSFTIELTYARNKPLTLELGQQFEDWLEDAHGEIKSIFKKSVTDKYLTDIA